MTLLYLTLNFFTDTIYIDTTYPEKLREIMLILFQDHADDGVLHNGFGIEILGADFNLFKKGYYKAWLVDASTVIPVGRLRQLCTIQKGAYTDWRAFRDL